MKRFWTMATAGTLVASLLTITAPAQGAPPSAPQVPSVVAAAKAPPPGISLGKKKTTTTKSPNKSTQSVVLPVLKGSTAADRKLFAKYAVDIVTSTQATFNKNRKGACRGSQTATLSINPANWSVYKARYASVAFSIVTYYCGAATANVSVRSFTLDLKTNKKASLGTFISEGNRTSKVAIATNFGLDKKSCTYELDPFTKVASATGYIPKSIAWNVSAKGIRLHYPKYSIAAGYCGAPSVLLPWTEVATAKAMGGPVKTRVYAYQIKWNPTYKFYEGAVFFVSVQGRNVTMFSGPAAPSHGNCLYGIRTGKSATMSPGMANYEQSLAKIKFSFLDTSSNPKLNPTSMGKGWKPATAKDLSAISKSHGKGTTARTICR